MLTIADIAELYKSIEIARYALAQIKAEFESADADIADKDLTKAANIMNKILDEISKQEKAEEETDGENS